MRSERFYYRRRLFNEARKSGNVRDFLNTWGRRYRYFICCDADSVMRGKTLVDLVKLMEAHPTVELDPDRSGFDECRIIIWTHPAIRQPPVCAGVYQRIELLVP